MTGASTPRVINNFPQSVLSDHSSHPNQTRLGCIQLAYSLISVWFLQIGGTGSPNATNHSPRHLAAIATHAITNKWEMKKSKFSILMHVFWSALNLDYLFWW